MGRVAFSEVAERPATSVRTAGMHGPWTAAIGKNSLANGGLPAIAFGFWLSRDGLLGASHATQCATPRHLGQKGNQATSSALVAKTAQGHLGHL